MSSNEHNTNRRRHQDGPVTRAIRAVREPTGPLFVPCQPEDEMRSGWHIARRHDWQDPARSEVVYLEVWEDARGFDFALWRVGGSKPENPMDWAFQVRIVGPRGMQDEPLDLNATRH